MENPDQMKSTVSSKLFPLLADAFDGQRGLQILDLGAAQPETVNFFAEYRCRLYLADINCEYAAARELNPCVLDNKESDQELSLLFRELLNFPEGTRFDICLFWDFFNYLDLPALRAFSSALVPYLHGNTKGHGFFFFIWKNPLPNQNYSVLDRGSFVCRERAEKQLPVYPHGQGVLGQNDFCLQVSKSLLLADGRIEMLLTAGEAKSTDRKQASG